MIGTTLARPAGMFTAESGLNAMPDGTPPLFLINTNAKALHQEEHTGDQREQAGDPAGDGKAEQEVQTEDKEEESENEMGHGIYLFAAGMDERAGRRRAQMIKTATRASRLQ